MAEDRLKDRVAIVTGAGSGIGRAIALRFAGEGARVAVLDVNEEQGAAVVGEIEATGGSAAFFRCDVSRQAEVLEVFAAVQDRLGPLDVLVNNAGIAHIGTVETTTEEDLDRVYAVNVKGVYNCLKAGVPMMKGRGGAILNLASILSSIAVPDRFAYAMSKGAVLTMTYSVAPNLVIWRRISAAVSGGPASTSVRIAHSIASIPARNAPSPKKPWSTESCFWATAIQNHS